MKKVKNVVIHRKTEEKDYVRALADGMECNEVHLNDEEFAKENGCQLGFSDDDDELEEIFREQW